MARATVPAMVCILGILWPGILIILMMNNILPATLQGKAFVISLFLPAILLLFLAAFLATRKLQFKTIDYAKVIHYGMRMRGINAYITTDYEPIPGMITYNGTPEFITKDKKITADGSMLFHVIGGSTLFTILYVVVMAVMFLYK
ncbi:hypothetical protein A2335_01010 [Candidatus Peregrinibacteria bacterium RIFOXYB2_FULL_32_7]|nr:MAG: hypothetical protein A2335_01010 [Candidatus Peregrinibacteria bacterium RIFOXYB2_FULL_32_7]